MRRCKSAHRKCWVFRDARWTEHKAVYWCYECGAIRFYPEDKKWIYPVGADGKNPAMTAVRFS